MEVQMEMEMETGKDWRVEGGASNCFVFVCLIGKSHTQKCTARNEFILFFLSFLKNSQRPDGVDLETNEQGH